MRAAGFKAPSSQQLLYSWPPSSTITVPPCARHASCIAPTCNLQPQSPHVTHAVHMPPNPSAASLLAPPAALLSRSAPQPAHSGPAVPPVGHWCAAIAALQLSGAPARRALTLGARTPQRGRPQSAQLSRTPLPSTPPMQHDRASTSAPEHAAHALSCRSHHPHMAWPRMVATARLSAS